MVTENMGAIWVWSNLRPVTVLREVEQQQAGLYRDLEVVEMNEDPEGYGRVWEPVLFLRRRT